MTSKSKQLELWPRTYTWRQRLYGWLLGWANADPPHSDWKYTFYRAKERILNLHGELVGNDWQRITHICRSCDGTGTWGHWRDDGGDWCYRCSGTGVYREFFILLYRYDVGGSTFHSPSGRFEVLPEGATVKIDGKVRHSRSGAKCLEASLWCVFLFNRESWWKMIRDPYLLPCGTSRFSLFKTDSILPMIAIHRLWQSVLGWCRFISGRCANCGKHTWSSDKPFCSEKCDGIVPF